MRIRRNKCIDLRNPIGTCLVCKDSIYDGQDTSRVMMPITQVHDSTTLEYRTIHAQCYDGYLGLREELDKKLGVDTSDTY